MTAIISVERLSKRYRIGQHEELGSRPFVSTLGSYLTRPFQNLRKLQGLSRIEDEDETTIWALRDICFDVQEGEVVGIIGANGAGKSTLLKILSRITPPTEGRIVMNGRVGSLLEVGTGFHPDLTGRENVYLNGTILGMRREEIRRKFDEIVEFSGIGKFIDTPIKRYSSGMQVRLAFAVAAHLEPEILIIDEVLSVGDADFQRKSLGKMQKTSQEGRTVIFVSHNMTSVSSLCERVYLLENGCIVKSGNAQTVIGHYLQTTDTGEGEVEVQKPIVLADHPNKTGEFSIMQVARLLGDGNEPTRVFTSRGRFRLEVICHLDPKTANQYSLGFSIRNLMGEVLFNVHLNQYRVFSVEKSGTYSFTAAIDPLPLAPGSYMLSFHIVSGKVDIEAVLNAVKFDVVWNNELDLLYPPGSTWGPLVMPVEWEIMAL